MTNVEAFAVAKRKATYGPHDHLVWKDRSGEFHTARRSPETLKTALLSVGTQGRFTVVGGKGVPFTYRWRDGVRMIRNARYGC